MRLGDALGGALALSALTFAPDAGAQDSSPQAQFDHGLAEMLAGRYATGCPELAASQRAEPRPGTLFTLAECELRWGHSASALRHLVSYLDAVVRLPSAADRELQTDRVKLATTQRADLERQVGHVLLALPEDTPADAIVREDGEAVERSLLAGPLAVDPGAHVFELGLPDGRKSQQAVNVARGEQRRVALVLPPPETTPAGTGQPESEVTSVPGPAGPAGAAGASSARTWMWVSGGVGAAGVVVGSVAAIVALTDKGAAASSCGTGGLRPGQCSSQQGVDAGTSARTWADVASVSFGVGGVGLATAVVLWLLLPSTQAQASAWQPRVGVNAELRWVGLSHTW